MINDYFNFSLKEEDYYRMAFRKYLGKVNNQAEIKFMHIVYMLKDIYHWEEINKLLNENKIAK